MLPRLVQTKAALHILRPVFLGNRTFLQTPVFTPHGWKLITGTPYIEQILKVITNIAIILVEIVDGIGNSYLCRKPCRYYTHITSSDTIIPP